MGPRDARTSISPYNTQASQAKEVEEVKQVKQGKEAKEVKEVLPCMLWRRSGVPVILGRDAAAVRSHPPDLSCSLWNRYLNPII